MIGAMSTESSPQAVRDPGVLAHARRLLRLAWVSTALIPVGFVIAMVVGEGLLSMQGYDSGAETAPPLGVALLAAGPAIVILVVPAVAAIVFGLRARRRGARNGIIPAVIGIVFVAYALLSNLLGLIVGW